MDNYASLPVFCFVFCHTEKELYYTGGKKGIRKKVVFEMDEATNLLHQYHSSPLGRHSGINATLSKVSQFYMWNGMKQDIVDYVSKHTLTSV